MSVGSDGRVNPENLSVYVCVCGRRWEEHRRGPARIRDRKMVVGLHLCPDGSGTFSLDRSVLPFTEPQEDAQ